jgi:hypothetical protein
MSTEFSLRKLASEVWDETGGTDYHVLAKELARRITATNREAALNEALVEYARHFVVGLRPTARRRRGTAAGQANSGRSSKVALIRRTWPQLRATYLTKDGQKALGDCTRVDVIFIAEHLERKARENQSKAGWMRELSAALGQHKVQRVRDLPDAVLAEFLGGAAA